MGTCAQERSASETHHLLYNSVDNFVQMKAKGRKSQCGVRTRIPLITTTFCIDFDYVKCQGTNILTEVAMTTSHIHIHMYWVIAIGHAHSLERNK